MPSGDSRSIESKADFTNLNDDGNQIQRDNAIKAVDCCELLKYSTWAYMKANLVTFIGWTAMELSIAPAAHYANAIRKNLKRYLPEERDKNSVG